MEYLHNLWAVLSDLAFWLLFGCFVSGLIHVFIPQAWLQKHLAGSGLLSVIKAVFVGVPMPLCSCGVIPAALGLKKKGAGTGSSMGFLISTPQTGVDSIFVSASMLSWPFALFKLASAFLLGIIGGLISNRIGDEEAECPQMEEVTHSHGGKLLSIYEFAVNDLLYMVWRWLVVGILISAAITTWMPPDLLADWSSYSLPLTLLAVLLFSLPLYVCATSSVPIAAALVDAGMPISAALVFLMAGPATNVATIGAVYKCFGVKHLLNYLLTIIIGSLILAYSFEFLLAGVEVKHVGHMHHVESYAVYALLFFFALFIVKDVRSYFVRNRKPKCIAEIKEYRLIVGGLSCQGCVKKLLTALEAIESVQKVTVDLEKGRVNLMGQAGLEGKFKDSIEKIGFELKESIN